MSEWTLEQIKAKIGQMINVCPCCRHKNYQYCNSCEECAFSWQVFYNQEVKAR